MPRFLLKLFPTALLLLIHIFQLQNFVASKLIIKGRDTSIEGFPFQLSLQFESFHKCGAAILNEQWAITAAHCVDVFRDMPSMFSFRVDTSSASKGGKIVPVSEIHVYPSYDADSFEYDVALLRVNGTLLGGKFAKPIKLTEDSAPIPVGMAANISGWGTMKFGKNKIPKVLQYTTVNIVDQAECTRNYKRTRHVKDNMFCAASRGTDSCQGDSGGPIQTANILYGVVSWGTGCAREGFPGVYTRLAYSPIRSWIKSLTGL